MLRLRVGLELWLGRGCHPVLYPVLQLLCHGAIQLLRLVILNVTVERSKSSTLTHGIPLWYAVEVAVSL